MTSEIRRLGGVAGTIERRRDAQSLKAERLARRVPRFAGFVEGPEGVEGDLTDEQREFLDKFSTGLSEALSEERQEPGEAGGGKAPG